MIEAHCLATNETDAASKFRKGLHLATDPICGMSVDPAKAAAKIDHAGQSYYFCSKGCAQRFAQSPDKYAAAIDSQKHSSPPVIQSNAVANSTPVAVPNH